MKTITLAQAFDILTRASNDGAVVVDSHTTDRLHMDRLTGQADNQFALLVWEDGDGQEFRCGFTEENNPAPQVNGSKLLLTDDEGDLIELVILMPANLG